MLKALTHAFEVTTYVSGAQIDTRTMSADELKGTDAEKFDHLIDTVRGVYGYRTADGDWQEQSIDASGLGKTGLDIVRALQLNLGVFMKPREIAELVGNSNLHENNVLAARLKVIRAAHGENGANPRFFASRRNGGYALKWPEEFSWIWIDRI